MFVTVKIWNRLVLSIKPRRSCCGVGNTAHFGWSIHHVSQKHAFLLLFQHFALNIEKKIQQITMPYRYSLLSQNVPLKPRGHWHVNPLTPSSQIPPFWHGPDAHSLISKEQKIIMIVILKLMFLVLLKRTIRQIVIKM